MFRGFCRCSCKIRSKGRVDKLSWITWKLFVDHKQTFPRLVSKRHSWSSDLNPDVSYRADGGGRLWWCVEWAVPGHHQLHRLSGLLQEGEGLLLADPRLQRAAVDHQDLVPLLETPVPAAATSVTHMFQWHHTSCSVCQVCAFYTQ